MLFSSLTKITLALAPLSAVTAQTSCTLTASGGDDAPALLQAVRSCATTQIPNDVTLNIATRMNMTGLIDKHIVGSQLFEFPVSLSRCIFQQLEGTLRFSPDIPYWTGVRPYLWLSHNKYWEILEWVLHSISDPNHVLVARGREYCVDRWWNARWCWSGRYIAICPKSCSCFHIWNKAWYDGLWVGKFVAFESLLKENEVHPILLYFVRLCSLSSKQATCSSRILTT